MSSLNWVHFVGIAGVTTGQLAVEYQRNGWLVTGSDKGLFPPMSSYIQQQGISIEIGYKQEHLNSEYYIQKYELDRFEHLKHPSLVISGGTKGEKNIEIIEAKKLNIPIKNFPQILQDNVIVDNSIVVAGTYGKSTITSMLVDVFLSAGKNISYMFGALSTSGLNGVKFSEDQTEYSIVEGDEYIESIENPVSKFFRYAPKYLILTAVEWDHTDIFKARSDYLDNYKKLINSVPEDGIIIVDETNPDIHECVKDAKCRVVYLADYNLEKSNTGGLSRKGFDLKVIGDFNQKNALFTYALACELSIDREIALMSLSNYSGIKRRLEIRYSSNEVDVVDDFGASAPKAEVSLSSVRKHYPNSRIVAIFEPNLGSRTKECLGEYQKSFKEADIVLLPRFTKVPGEYISANDLGESLANSNVNVLTLEKDNEVINKIYDNILLRDKHLVILFMGSHGFRGMIEDIIDLIKNGRKK
jgi:UDP-N-acetylmuramate: L-alanyl-gamma-D-glutamyl-meso-diaminopimelate ligase